MFLHADSEDSDQTGWTPRLICIFAGHTGRFVGFVVQRLICCCESSGKVFCIYFTGIDLLLFDCW